MTKDATGRPEGRPLQTVGRQTVSRRGPMPMFTVTNAVDGTGVHYGDIWQRKNVVLVTASANDPTAVTYTSSIIAAAPRLASADAAVIVTWDTVAGIPPPSVVIADRWGEIYNVSTSGRAAELPSADEILDWLEYVQNECPECQGEAR